MNKISITLICITVIISGIFVAGIILEYNKNKTGEIMQTKKIAEEVILDDCTDEYEDIKNIVQANSNNEEKISPNCSFKQETYYKKCGHTIIKSLKVPQDLINLTKNEVEEKYPNWKIDKFSSNEIIISKEEVGECGEHYLIKDNSGKLVIYMINEDGSEIEFEKTDISTEYLTETDRIDIEKGIRVNGKEELNKFIENFE